MNKHRPLRVVRIIEGTTVDGPGMRTSIYFAGCRHRCPGCHNPSTWDFDAGRDMSVAEVTDIIREYGLPVTFSGGDPMYQSEALLPLAKAIKTEGFNLWCYTGFTLDDILADASMRALLAHIDVLVDGPFMESRRDTSLIFRGSDNQRLIDVAKTLASGKPVLFIPDTAVKL